MAVSLQDAPLGSCHPVACCCWCGAALCTAEVETLRCWVCPRCWARQTQFRLWVSGKKGKGAICAHVPLPSQVPIYEARVGYFLWGGRAGPGKSTGGRRWLYWRSLLVPGHEALLLRENWDQLKANHTLKMAGEVEALGGRYYETDRLAVFGKGSDQSLIFCGHMADVEALGRYVGIEYDAIVADEASLYPVDGAGIPVLAELSTRARKVGRTRAGVVMPGIFVAVTNPGGPTAPWLRDMFIDHTPEYDLFPYLRPGVDARGQPTGYQADQWVYQAASLKDNPYMREDYAQTVLAVLSGTRYKQLAEGDWNAFAGAFFPMWDAAIHVRQAVWTS
jgi:hypothetical protein